MSRFKSGRWAIAVGYVIGGWVYGLIYVVSNSESIFSELRQFFNGAAGSAREVFISRTDPARLSQEEF